MTRPCGLGMVGWVCCLAASAYGQGLVYVNGVAGDDTWDGRCEVWDGSACGPKATIQAGINSVCEPRIQGPRNGRNELSTIEDRLLAGSPLPVRGV